MGIRVTCPNCNKQLNVKSFLAGKRGVCPDCRTKFEIPAGGEHKEVLVVEESEETITARQQDIFRRQEALAPPVLIPAPGVTSTVAPAIAPAAVPAQPVGGFAPAPVFGAPAVAAPVAMPAVPDPIAQAPQAAWHVSSAAGEKYGPVAGDVLRQWIAERRLMPDSLVWQEGWDQWRRADAVFAELAAVQTAPAIAAPAVPVPGITPAGESPVVLAFPSEPARATIARSYSRRSNNTRTLMMILLVVAVLILAPLLGYVLVQQF